MWWGSRVTWWIINELEKVNNICWLSGIWWFWRSAASYKRETPRGEFFYWSTFNHCWWLWQCIWRNKVIQTNRFFALRCFVTPGCFNSRERERACGRILKSWFLNRTFDLNEPLCSCLCYDLMPKVARVLSRFVSFKGHFVDHSNAQNSKENLK